MPRISRLFGHVDGVSRPQPQQQVSLALHSIHLGLRRIRPVALARGNHEEPVASEAQADESTVGLLADVAVHHHSVARRVEIDNSGLSERGGEEGLEEGGEVGREGRGLLIRVDAVGPVVLTSQSDPVEAAAENLARGEGLVDGGVLGGEEAGGVVRGKGEEGGGCRWVGDVVVKVHVTCVLGIAEIAVDHEVHELGLYNWRDQVGYDE